jgi:uncharacterized membrane protein
MMMPDYTLIAEVMLFSEGFKQAQVSTFSATYSALHSVLQAITAIAVLDSTNGTPYYTFVAN